MSWTRYPTHSLTASPPRYQCNSNQSITYTPTATGSHPRSARSCARRPTTCALACSAPSSNSAPSARTRAKSAPRAMSPASTSAILSFKAARFALPSTLLISKVLPRASLLPTTHDFEASCVPPCTTLPDSIFNKGNLYDCSFFACLLVCFYTLLLLEIKLFFRCSRRSVYIKSSNQFRSCSRISQLHANHART